MQRGWEGERERERALDLEVLRERGGEREIGQTELGVSCIHCNAERERELSRGVRQEGEKLDRQSWVYHPFTACLCYCFSSYDWLNISVPVSLSLCTVCCVNSISVV